jgi:hypothetical protein
MAGFDYDVLISPVVPAGARGELRLEAKQSGDGRRMRTAPPRGSKQPAPLALGDAKRLRAFLRTRFRALPLQNGLKT